MATESTDEGLLAHPTTWSIDERRTEAECRQFEYKSSLVRTIPKAYSSSVVAIHGLGGNRKATWTYTGDEKSVMWLTDLLPRRLKNPKIMTYDYNIQSEQDIVGPNIMAIAHDLLQKLCAERESKKVL
jgi:hypothetical protein